MLGAWIRLPLRVLFVAPFCGPVAPPKSMASCVDKQGRERNVMGKEKHRPQTGDNESALQKARGAHFAPAGNALPTCDLEIADQPSRFGGNHTVTNIAFVCTETPRFCLASLNSLGPYWLKRKPEEDRASVQLGLTTESSDGADVGNPKNCGVRIPET